MPYPAIYSETLKLETLKLKVGACYLARGGVLWYTSRNIAAESRQYLHPPRARDGMGGSSLMKCQECGKEGEGDVCAFCGGTIEESPRWYAEGIAHLTEQKQYAIAFDLLEEGIERYPSSAMLWYNGGVLEELLGNRDGAITRYQKVLELRPNNEKARKALERLLGRPLFVPPPTSSHPASGDAPVATAPEAPVATAPTTDITAPPAVMPVIAETTKPATQPPPAPAMPSVGPNGAEAVPSYIPQEPIETDLPLTLPSAAPDKLPWQKIRLINGIGALVTFLAMLVGMIIKINLVFVIALVLFCITLIVFYASGAMANTPQGRRRR